MSKSVASESNEGYESGGMSRKRGARDEGDENEERIPEVAAADNSTTSTNVTTVTAATDQFMHTAEFKRHFAEFVHVQMLMALRLATKGFNAAADALIDKGVMSGELMVHGGNDISEEVATARKERHKLATRAIFLLNITKVGENACWLSVNFVVVEIPEGVERIGEDAFVDCTSLTTISFPKTLTLIDYAAFGGCSSLENVGLLHTNLQELRGTAF
ncbi:hypothetical protein TL16_g06608 [Triparma laevis f. inornata]|uniref:Uncharacterized protein n=1 Tax=Triparma laevis f. inornata TaxID=1714386 RepID=A0A9W7EB71_9STRA|nr:hypothetical protein TL16_g06608 [Triparma laevis f. inornata]